MNHTKLFGIIIILFIIETIFLGVVITKIATQRDNWKRNFNNVYNHLNDCLMMRNDTICYDNNTIVKCDRVYVTAYAGFD